MSNEYPKWRYHANFETFLVRSEEQSLKMGEGWEDTPAKFGRDTENAPDANRFILSELKEQKKPRKREDALA